MRPIDNKERTRVRKMTSIPLLLGTLALGGMIGGYTSFASAQSTTDSTVAPTTTGTTHPLGKRFGKGPGMKGKMGMGKGEFGHHGVMGTVTAVNGNTITVTGPGGTSYTVDGGAATVQKVVTSSVSQIAVGDTIGVQGTVTGTNVAATHIMSGIPAPEFLKKTQ